MAKERRALTAQEVVDMHSYCITLADVKRSTSGNLYIPKSLDPVCEHPEHGWCGHRSPSDIELLGINAILNDVKDAPKADAQVSAPKTFASLKQKIESNPERRTRLDQERQFIRAKLPKPKRYFCVKCNLYHVEGDPKLPLKTVGPGYDKHTEFKRKRGRPVGWRKKK